MNNRRTSADLISALQEIIHRILTPVMPSNGKFALLDFPNHGNVGDSAIWLGETTYFQAMHRFTPAYVCDYRSFSADELEKALPGNSPIFLTGGGNFGDLWPAHQHFREAVLSRFPERPIIQLPQSLHFSSNEALLQAVKAVKAHPNFTLLVRDHQSLAFAREHFSCRIELCPDMAFYLGPIRRPRSPALPLLLVMRSDKERAEKTGISEIPPSAPVVDWVGDEPDFRRKTRSYRLTMLPTLGVRVLRKESRHALHFKRMAEARLKRGVNLLSSAEFIISDRLHVHILSVLLDLPHVALDNSYRKISNFVQDWTKDCEIVRTEDTLVDALRFFDAR